LKAKRLSASGGKSIGVARGGLGATPPGGPSPPPQREWKKIAEPF